jgi:hypothetical protein
MAVENPPAAVKTTQPRPKNLGAAGAAREVKPYLALA